jgi:hypothetical protein
MPAATAIQVRASMRAPLAGAPGTAWEVRAIVFP